MRRRRRRRRRGNSLRGTFEQVYIYSSFSCFHPSIHPSIHSGLDGWINLTYGPDLMTIASHRCKGVFVFVRSIPTYLPTYLPIEAGSDAFFLLSRHQYRHQSQSVFFSSFFLSFCLFMWAFSKGAGVLCVVAFFISLFVFSGGLFQRALACCVVWGYIFDVFDAQRARKKERKKGKREKKERKTSDLM